MGGERPTQTAKDITNRDLVLYALHLVGGHAAFVPTEVIAVKAFELYAERFGLVRYTQHPDVDAVRVTLTDLRKPKHGILVEGDKRRGWRITDQGRTWLDANGRRVQRAIEQKHPKEVRIASGKLLTKGKITSLYAKRITESRGFARWKGGGAPTLYDFFDVLHVDQYTPEETYQGHLTDMLKALDGHPDLVKFLEDLDLRFGGSYREHGRDAE